MNRDMKTIFVLLGLFSLFTGGVGVYIGLSQVRMFHSVVAFVLGGLMFVQGVSILVSIYFTKGDRE